MLNVSIPFYCGTSNVALPVPDKEHYPPQFQNTSRLHYYASLFNTVEVNSSFHRIPMQRTVEKWVNDVPANFRFTFKLWRGITHAKELNYETADIARFLHAINIAGDKKGCILIQFPASIKIAYLQKVRKLLDDLQVALIAGWMLAVEFRDKEWYTHKVYQSLEQYHAIVVTQDMPASATPFRDMNAAFVYLRFHGENGRYRGTYATEILQNYAAAINNWRKNGKTVFTYFNNTLGEAAQNAITLQGLLEPQNSASLK
jgi:uncharacterized protein YecE (DUF72 family)